MVSLTSPLVQFRLTGSKIAVAVQRSRSRRYRFWRHLKPSLTTYTRPLSSLQSADRLDRSPNHRRSVRNSVCTLLGCGGRPQRRTQSSGRRFTELVCFRVGERSGEETACGNWDSRLYEDQRSSIIATPVHSTTPSVVSQSLHLS